MDGKLRLVGQMVRRFCRKKIFPSVLVNCCSTNTPLDLTGRGPPPVLSPSRPSDVIVLTTDCRPASRGFESSICQSYTNLHVATAVTQQLLLIPIISPFF